MKLKKMITILTLSGLAVAGLLGVVVYRSVQAASSTRVSLGPALDRQISGGLGFLDRKGEFELANGGPDFPGRGFGGTNNQDLANALGIMVDDLQSAFQKANQAAIDQALQNGLITQAQADQLKNNGAAFPFGGRWDGWMAQNGIDFNALLADALGITTEKLQAAYQQAFETRIDQAVTDGKLSQDQADLIKGQNALFSNETFRSSMQNAYETAVQQAITNGVITQAQADAILSAKGSMNFPGFMGPHGFGGERGFDRKGDPGFPNLGNPPESVPSATP